MRRPGSGGAQASEGSAASGDVADAGAALLGRDGVPVAVAATGESVGMPE